MGLGAGDGVGGCGAVDGLGVSSMFKGEKGSFCTPGDVAGSGVRTAVFIILMTLEPPDGSFVPRAPCVTLYRYSSNGQYAPP